MNRLGFGNRPPWAVSLYLPGHAVGKSVSFIVNGYGIKIRTVYLQNTDLNCCCSTSLLHCFRLVQMWGPQAVAPCNPRILCSLAV